MGRSTIDYGIDLGTTNSAIAVLNGTEPEIVTNQRGSTITPSAVWIDKRGRIRIGGEAKDRCEVDRDNCDIEFKARMGKGESGKKHFVASGRQMLPEELSAEVLKSLKADVHTKYNEAIRAAVITVPAAFELRQCDATREAGKLAGFLQSPLLQEPVAASLAYGFTEVKDNLHWLVYDFGGGTFDAAIVQVRDGVIQVVNHAGDNHLGGKLVDWDIVEKKLVPALVAQFSLDDFRRGNSRWMAAFAKLKAAAEQAKIDVCRTREPSEIWVEDLCEDDRGQTIDLELELTPGDVEEVFEPYFMRSVDLCRQALQEKALTGKDMEKILMVGGTTLIPWLRERVESELNAPLEYSLDPMTVVAVGAAIFAGTQRLAEDDSIPVPEGMLRVELEYDPVGADEDPEVFGRVHRPSGEELRGYTVEIVEPRSQWRSGKIPLADDGAFEVVLLAERGRRCEFAIELSDPQGGRRATTPERFPYTVGTVSEGAPLIHTLGVAMANNQVDVFFKKGTDLPARRRQIHHTAYPVRKGESGDLIDIPIVEGEHLLRADRNQLAGRLTIPSDRIARDLPVGTEVEITMNVDQSRLVKAEAYIPILDQHEEVVVNLDSENVNADQLRQGLDRQQRRLEMVREKVARTTDRKAGEALSRIDREQMLGQAETAIAAADNDVESADIGHKVLRSIQVALDHAEDVLEWPALVDEANENLRSTRELVEEYGDSDDQRRLSTLESDLEHAIGSHDPDVLRRHSGDISLLGTQVLTRQPGFWVSFLQHLEERRSHMRDSYQADQLFAQGRRALNNNDLEGLKAAVRQLTALLPADEQEEVRGLGGTTLRQ